MLYSKFVRFVGSGGSTLSEVKAYATLNSPKGIADGIASVLDHVGKRKSVERELAEIEAAFAAVDAKALRKCLNAGRLQIVLVEASERLPDNSTVAPADQGTLFGARG